MRRRDVLLTVHQRRSFVLPAVGLCCLPAWDLNVVGGDCRAVCLNLIDLPYCKFGLQILVHLLV